MIASVSNWGGYGLVAALSSLVRQDLLPTVDDERRLVDIERRILEYACCSSDPNTDLNADADSNSDANAYSNNYANAYSDTNTDAERRAIQLLELWCRLRA